METSEYLSKEYRILTDRYATGSRHLKELLYQINALPEDKDPDFKAIKELLRELHKLEDVLEYVTGRLHYVFHQLMILIKEEDLVKKVKPKKKATKAKTTSKTSKTKRTTKATKPAKTSTAPKKPKKAKKEKAEK